MSILGSTKVLMTEKLRVWSIDEIVREEAELVFLWIFDDTQVDYYNILKMMMMHYNICLVGTILLLYLLIMRSEYDVVPLRAAPRLSAAPTRSNNP
jgi:hypothetical protein